MIVITTNNSCVERECKDGQRRKYFLESILKSLQNIGCIDDVLIVDTGTTDQESIEYLESLRTKNFGFNIILDKTPYRGYDSGAIVWSVKNHISDYYFFFHDSLEIKNNFFTDVKKSLDEKSVGCWLAGYDSGYDNESQKGWVSEAINAVDYDFLIFGSIFFVKRETILKVIDQINILPNSKNEANGMERGWPSLFKKNNISIFPIDGEYDYHRMLDDGYINIRKHLAGRQ